MGFCNDFIGAVVAEKTRNQQNGANSMDIKTGKKRKRKSYVQEPVKIPADVLLMDAIVRVVAKKGVEGASTRAIAAEAGRGLTDTVIYRFFSSKEDLMQKAFVRESTAFMKQVELVLPSLWENKISREQRRLYDPLLLFRIL